MPDHPLLDDAAAIAYRRPASPTSQSDGIRLLHRLARLFGAPAAEAPESRAASLFLWGPLEVKRALGAGSFGEVFAAWDPTLQREVALKLRTPEVGTLRWLDEARNLARIRHAHVLTVHGADVLDGRAGIWTELVAGRTLEEELEATGPFAEGEALRIGRDIASALVAVHAAGLVHGDVKTSNIMLEDGDSPRRAVLVDFGSADRMLGTDDVPSYVVGTPLTMAPEVLDGQPATGASDVYGLGATLFRLLTGRYPVETASIDELKRAHASGEKRSARAVASHISPRLSSALERALEPKPAKRWPNAVAFRRALDDVADPTRRIRARAAAIGAAVAALAAIAVVAILVARPGSGPIARAALSTPRTPGILDEVWRRGGSGSRIGWVWSATVLDIDGDGFDDLFAGEARWAGADSVIRGRVLVFHGGASGLGAIPDSSLAGDIDDVQFGDHLDPAGDVNADGFDDLLVMERSTNAQQLRPRVRLYLGSPAGATASSWSITGRSRDSWLGTAMTSAGDVNRDGYGDALINEGLGTYRFEAEGAVYLFLGSPSGLASTPAWTAYGGRANVQLGTWMRAAGDVNGDGYDDVLLGAAMWDGAAIDCGQARVYYSGPAGVSSEPDWTIEGAGANSQLGTTLGGAGDVNGDGFDDIVIGEPRYSDEGRPERGRAMLFFGGPEGLSRAPDWQTLGPVAYMHAGYWVIGIGDLDDDGFDDIAVGSPQYTDGSRTHLGAAEVYRGGAHGIERTAAWRALGDRPDAHLGQFVWGGDFNGDGVPDLVLGAPMWGDSVPERGLFVAYLGQRPRP